MNSNPNQHLDIEALGAVGSGLPERRIRSPAEQARADRRRKA
jgi:hypothetical protein